jgi:hypothetical protein
MNFLLELLEPIAIWAMGKESSSKAEQFARATDLDPFVQLLESNGRPDGLERCADSTFCLDEAVLVCEVQPMITPDRRSIVDATLDDLTAQGVKLTEIERPHPGVLAFAGSSDAGRFDGRVVPARGWVFLVSADEEADASRMLTVLDSTIAAFEGDSG